MRTQSGSQQGLPEDPSRAWQIEEDEEGKRGPTRTTVSAPQPAVRCPRGSTAWASPAALAPLSTPYSRESSPFRPPPRLIGPRLYRAAPLVQQQAARAYFLSSKPHLTFSPPRESAPARSLHSGSSAGCCAQSLGFDWRWLDDCFRDWKQDCREGQAVAPKSGDTTAKTTGASKENHLLPFHVQVLFQK